MKKDTFLVVECKKDGISYAEFEQAIEQAFGNGNSLRSHYISIIAGTTRMAYDLAGFDQGEREKNIISDIPVKYGKVSEFRFVKGDNIWDLRIVSKDELIRTLEKAHDTVWQGGRLAPTKAFDEISKLLFCKIKDEKETKEGKPYEFQIGTHDSPEDVFNRINKIYQRAKKADSEVFKENIDLKPEIVYTVVQHLKTINFNKTDLDTKGMAFERFMEDFFKGKMGQYFTPREIIKFCVQMLSPTSDDLILDPACGSGGFLLNSLDFVRKDAEDNYDEFEGWEKWHRFAEKNLFGIEINEQIARICKMNMIIHDDGHTNVISTDALDNFEKIQGIHKKFKENNFDIILTNPPFGASIKESENQYLVKYNLAKNKKRQKSEILFVERCIDFLRSGGRMAIVLPDGILTNTSQKYVRNFIKENTEIFAVISLPIFAFSHYGAGVKSSLLFLRKKGKNEKLNNYPIFMAIADHIGYDATGRYDEFNDLDIIYNEFQKFLDKQLAYPGLERKED